MSFQVDKRALCSWLERNGFQRSHNSSGHIYFTHAASGVKIGIPAHGTKDMKKKTMSNVLRQLEAIGFDKSKVRDEVRGAA